MVQRFKSWLGLTKIGIPWSDLSGAKHEGLHKGWLSLCCQYNVTVFICTLNSHYSCVFVVLSWVFTGTMAGFYVVLMSFVFFLAGITWKNLHTLDHTAYTSPRRDYIPLPLDARTPSTKMRWWQPLPSNPFIPRSQWAIDNVYIGMYI